MTQAQSDRNKMYATTGVWPLRYGLSASAKRPGWKTGNHYPSCTEDQARKFDTSKTDRTRR